LSVAQPQTMLSLYHSEYYSLAFAFILSMYFYLLCAGLAMLKECYTLAFRLFSMIEAGSHILVLSEQFIDDFAHAAAAIP